jgi:DNA polymerase/3'-5' exonuclease PolX
MHALTKRKKIIPPRSSPSCACPASVRRPAARIWKELGVTTVEELKHAAEQEQLRTLTGLGAKTEERS